PCRPTYTSRGRWNGGATTRITRRTASCTPRPAQPCTSSPTWSGLTPSGPAPLRQSHRPVRGEAPCFDHLGPVGSPADHTVGHLGPVGSPADLTVDHLGPVGSPAEPYSRPFGPERPSR